MIKLTLWPYKCVNSLIIFMIFSWTRTYYRTFNSLVPSKRQSACQGGSQTTPDGDVFTVVCGVDYPGNDLIQYPETDIDNCLQQCSRNHPLCVGVAFEASLAHGPNNCYLKSSIGAAVTQTYSMDGAYSFPTATSETCSSENSLYVSSNGWEFSLTCGYDLPGNDLVQFHTASLDACMETCVQYGQGCVGVAYEASLQHGFNNCYLKNAAGTPTKQPFVVDGALLVSISMSASESAQATSSSVIANQISTSDETIIMTISVTTFSTSATSSLSSQATQSVSSLSNLISASDETTTMTISLTTSSTSATTSLSSEATQSVSSSSNLISASDDTTAVIISPTIFSTSTTAMPASQATQSVNPSSNNTGMKIGVGVGVSLGVLFISLLIIFFLRRTRTGRSEPQHRFLSSKFHSGTEKIFGREELEAPSTQRYELPGSRFLS